MKKHIEAEKGELIIVSDEGHRAIIPAKDRKYFLDSLNGCDDCINKYIQQLPMMSNYAEDGSLVPDDGDPIKKETYEQWGDRIRKMSPNLDYTKDGDYNYRGAYEAGLEPVEVDNNGVKEYHLGSRNPKTGEILKYRSHPTFNQAISEDVKMGYVPYEKDGRIYTVDRKSKEYKDLYDSGKLLGYDRVNDLYIAPDLGGATIKATKPQWMKDKEALEKEYSKDWYIDNNLPKFSRSMGVSPNNMGGNQKGYDEYINNKLAESILKRNPNFDKDYSNNRLKTLSNYSQKELEIIKNSNLSYKVEPSIWSKFEQGLLSVGNAGSPVTFKNENLTQKEAKKEDNPLNILQPLSVPSKMVQSVYKKDYSLKDALKGKQNNAGIVEDIVTDPLNLVGAGLVGKLSKTDKIIDATKVGSKVLNKLDDAVNNINRIKFDDFKNDNEFFRVIVGDEAFDDIVQTQKIRTKQPSSVKNTPPNTINLDRRGSTAFPSFSKGSPSLSYANDNPNHYIIRTADESIKPSTSGRHEKGTTMFPTDKSGKHLTELDASKVQVYKHVGNGEYELVNTAKPIVSSVDDVSKQASKQWQLEELPGLHLKSTMSNNPKGLHTYVAKDGSIDTKSALDHLKRMEGDARYEVVLKNMQKKYGSNLENMPKRMDYNTLRKNIQDDLWNVGTGKGQPVDQYAGLDMKKFGIVKNDKTTSLGYESDEINLTGYSFTNKNNFIGGSNAHNMPQETLGHSRGFINPKEPGVYYSVERQSNWAQEANSNIIDPITAQRVKRKDIYERLLRNEKSLQEGIIEQDALIAAGNDTWAIMQKERMQDQLKSVQSIINDHHRYINASPQEKLVMKNMNERMLQEDVVYAATQGHTKYRMPSEEAMVKIQGWSKEKILTPENIAKREEIIQKQNKVFTKYQQAIAKRDKISEDIYSKEYDALNLEIKKINETAALGDYTDAQKTILKHTSQSLKDAEKLFGVKLKPITDSKGNTWYEFDIPKKFKKGKGEIKAFQVIPPAIGSALYLQSQNKNKSK